MAVIWWCLVAGLWCPGVCCPASFGLESSVPSGVCCWLIRGRLSPLLQAFQGKRDGMAPHIFSVAQRAYWSLLMQRQDQAIVPLGRSGAGKTTCCLQALEYLVATAGSLDNRVTGRGGSRGAAGEVGRPDSVWGWGTEQGAGGQGKGGRLQRL